MYSFHSAYSNTLTDIVDSFDLKLSCSIQQISTWYADNVNDANSIINLIFLCLNSTEIDNYNILSELHHLLDYAPLTVDISITKEFVQDKCQTIIRNSEEENNFISDLIKANENIDTIIILDKESLKFIVQK